MTRIALATLLVGTLTIGVLAAADPVSRRDAARLQAKIDRITRNGEVKGKARTRTPITESELNSYLRYELGDQIPKGVKDPWVSIVGDGRLSGRATVDLAQIAQSRKSTGALDPFNYLGGSFPLAINGVLRTQNGVGTFALESATVSGLPVPSWMLQEIVSYYSKSENAPHGVSIEKPFLLPAGIREIQIARGQAIVVQ
jgi:hypothetical protein